VGAINAEGSRRAEEVKKRKSWAVKKQDIEAQVNRLNDDIQAQWQDALSKEGPYELNKVYLCCLRDVSAEIHVFRCY
jgi:hypothetical protein